MVAVATDELGSRLRRLRQHGMSAGGYERREADRVVVEEYVEQGFNYRMTDIQAAIGLVQRTGSMRSSSGVAARPPPNNQVFDGLRGVTAPVDPPYGTTNYQTYTLRIGPDAATTRDGLVDELRAHGVASKPALMAAHLEPTFAGHPHAPLPVTEQIHRDGLVLPLFHEMTDAQRERVIDAVILAVEGGS